MVRAWKISPVWMAVTASTSRAGMTIAYSRGVEPRSSVSPARTRCHRVAMGVIAVGGSADRVADAFAELAADAGEDADDDQGDGDAADEDDQAGDGGFAA